MVSIYVGSILPLDDFINYVTNKVIKENYQLNNKELSKLNIEEKLRMWLDSVGEMEFTFNRRNKLRGQFVDFVNSISFEEEFPFSGHNVNNGKDIFIGGLLRYNKYDLVRIDNIDDSIDISELEEKFTNAGLPPMNIEEFVGIDTDHSLNYLPPRKSKMT